MEKFVVIVAGGKGARMGSEMPKQFLPIGNGKPILMHTVEAFFLYDPQIRIILVLPEAQQAYWKELCEIHDFTIDHSVVNGGETRFHSVMNALDSIESFGSDDIVGIHDGVRPFVSIEVIQRCYEGASRHGAVIPVIDVYETVRKVTANENLTVDRNNYKLVQTPQAFRLDIIKKAYRQEYNSAFTDDASVVEASGTAVRLVEGNRENIKITTPYDLKIAGALL